ncbi:MAG: FAD synthetase family protein [Treponema sp.]|nr:FAD synthetase family protein [Treponema sp.]
MQVIEWETFLEKGLPAADVSSAVTIGVFDGVHRGHQALISRIINYDKKMVPVIITFRQNHKGKTLNSNNAYPGDLTSFEQKIFLFKQMGVSIVVAAELSESFRRLRGEEFLDILRDRGRMGFLAVGKNFRCGYNQDTDAQKIREINTRKNIRTEIIGVLNEANEPINSSRIRLAVAGGLLAQAQAMLGRPYVLDIREAVFTQEKQDSITVIETAGLRLALPPSGTYRVLLHGCENTGEADAATANSKIADAIIKDSLIKIPYTNKYDFVEFIT